MERLSIANGQFQTNGFITAIANSMIQVANAEIAKLDGKPCSTSDLALLVCKIEYEIETAIGLQTTVMLDTNDGDGIVKVKLFDILVEGPARAG